MKIRNTIEDPAHNRVDEPPSSATTPESKTRRENPSSQEMNE